MYYYVSDFINNGYIGKKFFQIPVLLIFAGTPFFGTELFFT